MTRVPSPLATLEVYVDAPEAFVPRATWTLETLLAPLGRTLVVTREPGRAGEAALAYAPVPVAGVPTIPRSDEAMDLFGASRPLPAGAFRRRAPAGPVRRASPALRPRSCGLPGRGPGRLRGSV